MISVNVAIAFDVDRPRGAWIQGDKGHNLLLKKIEFTQKACEMLDSYKAKRTLFVCGQFLEEALERVSVEDMRHAFPSSSLIEVGNHTYSHSALLPIPSRTVEDPILPLDEIQTEIAMTNKVATEIFLKAKVAYFMRGLRTPLGYATSVLDDKGIAAALGQTKLSYISSKLRGTDWGLYAETTAADLRRPYKYPGGLLEIPSHGWQDSAFTGNPSTVYTITPPKGVDEIKRYYLEEFTRVTKILEQNAIENFTYVLCWHFFDMRQYDPELQILKFVLGEVFPKFNIKPILYSDIT